MKNVAPAGAPPAALARPALRSWDDWLKEIGRVPSTGWRWRKAGWVRPVNVAGRLYISTDEIARFVARAEAGEFAKEHKTPSRSILKEAA